MTKEIGKSNIFLSLFDWRPRDNLTPAENFLTEAFVHVLCMNAAFRQRWLETILGEPAADDTLKIDTRASYASETGTTIYPDIKIVGQLLKGAAFSLLIENKWDARHDTNQIIKYSRLFLPSEQSYLVFICASVNDCNLARRHALEDENIEFKVLMWEEVYEELKRENDRSGLLGDLLEFMEFHGLSPGKPFTEEMISGFIASREFYPKGMTRFAEKLLNEGDWSFIPEYYRPEGVRVREAYGRIAIVFMPPGGNAAITVGFLYDNFDHKIPFADSNPSGVDVILRVEAQPKLGSARNKVIQLLKLKADKLRADGSIVRLADDPLNRNRHTLLIAQRSLRTTIRGKHSERDQVQAVYDQVKVWMVALFDDGELSRELIKLASVSATGQE